MHQETEVEHASDRYEPVILKKVRSSNFRV